MEVDNLTLSQINAFLRYAGKLEAGQKLETLLLTAVAAQGDKKGIDKVAKDLKKAAKKM